MIESLRLSLHITRRNWAVYVKDFVANISPTISDPIFFILSLGVGLGSFVSDVDGRTYLQYLAPGLAASTALLTSFFEASYGFYVRMTFENVFKAMLTTPIGVREVVLGEFIWLAIKGAVMTAGVTLVLSAFGLYSSWLLLPLILVVGVLVSLACGALGLLATAFVRNINQFQTVYSFLISPLFFFSGIFFPLSQFPEPLETIARLSPLALGVTMAQAVFWNEGILEVWLKAGPLLLIESLLLCWFAYVRIRRKLEA